MDKGISFVFPLCIFKPFSGQARIYLKMCVHIVEVDKIILMRKIWIRRTTKNCNIWAIVLMFINELNRVVRPYRSNIYISKFRITRYTTQDQGKEISSKYIESISAELFDAITV